MICLLHYLSTGCEGGFGVVFAYGFDFIAKKKRLFH